MRDTVHLLSYFSLFYHTHSSSQTKAEMKPAEIFGPTPMRLLGKSAQHTLLISMTDCSFSFGQSSSAPLPKLIRWDKRWGQDEAVAHRVFGDGRGVLYV